MDEDEDVSDEEIRCLCSAGAPQGPAAGALVSARRSAAAARWALDESCCSACCESCWRRDGALCCLWHLLGMLLAAAQAVAGPWATLGALVVLILCT